MSTKEAVLGLAYGQVTFSGFVLMLAYCLSLVALWCPRDLKDDLTLFRNMKP